MLFVQSSVSDLFRKTELKTIKERNKGEIKHTLAFKVVRNAIRGSVWECGYISELLSSINIIDFLNALVHSSQHALPAPRKRWQMMGGLLPSASTALACLPAPRDCIMTEDEVIMQHKGGTGAKILIRTGRKTLEEHVNVLLGPNSALNCEEHLAAKRICCRPYL